MKDAFQAILPINQAFARLWPRGGLKQPQQLANRLGGEGDASPCPKNYQEIMDKVSLKAFGSRLQILPSFNSVHVRLALFQIKCLTERENKRETQLAKQPKITALQKQPRTLTQ